MNNSGNNNILFSITRKDFIFEHFRCPGKGGQNVNKVNTGVRIIHRESGYSEKSCEHRTQGQNLKNAFIKLTNNRAFKAWIKTKALKLRTVDEIVDEMMEEKNLKVEVKNQNKWEQVTDTPTP